MRLIHTADWHLGHTLGGHPRDDEHAAFLAWLLDRIEDERADALLVCGDVFETGNAPATAQRLYYGFLANARRRFPKLNVVVIGGNHDAAPRLDAPGPVLSSLDVHVVGALPKDADGVLDASRCVIPLRGPSGDVEAVCAAVPFLRMADLPMPTPATTATTMPSASDAAGDAVVAGVRAAYQRVLDVARLGLKDKALLALGHCHMQGGAVTDDSERPLFGNQHALPVDIFPDDVAYAALGHLHFAQCVGGRREVRYSGSPIPLSMTERNYPHQVLVVDVDGPHLRDVRPLLVPRTVALARVPEQAAPVDEVLALLRALPVREPAGAPEDQARGHDFLEVRVQLDAPCPELRAKVEQALEGKAVRLVRVHRELAGDGGPLADTVALTSLAEIDPVSVLAKLYERHYGGAVPGDVLAAFAELLDEVTVAPRGAALDHRGVERGVA